MFGGLINKKAQLIIELDHEPGVQQAGDFVTGQVHVIVDTDCTCRGLTLDETTSIHGYGNNRTIKHTSLVLFQGDWVAGQNYSYPFELQLNHGPSTYEGQLVNITRRLTANADLPWAFDPNSHKQIGFRQPTSIAVMGESSHQRPDNVADIYGPNFVPGLQTSAKRSKFVLIPLLMVAALLVSSAPFWLYTSIAHASGGALIGLFFSLLVAAATVWFFGSAIAEFLLGEVSVELDNEFPRDGDNLDVLIHFTPRVSRTIRTLSAELVCEETATRGSGSNRKTKRSVQFREPFLEEHNVTVTAGQESIVGASVQMPQLSAQAFAIRDNRVDWYIKIKADLAFFPDWHGRVHLGATH